MANSNDLTFRSRITRGTLASSTLRQSSDTSSEPASSNTESTLDHDTGLPYTQEDNEIRQISQDARSINSAGVGSSSDSEGGIPKDVKIGMSVGFAIAMIMIIILLLLYVRERTKRKNAEKLAEKAEKKARRRSRRLSQSPSISKRSTVPGAVPRTLHTKVSWSDGNISSSNSSWRQPNASDQGLWRPTPPPERMSRASVVSRYWGEDSATPPIPDLRLYAEVDAGPVDEKRYSLPVGRVHAIEKDSLPAFPDPRLYSEKE